MERKTREKKKVKKRVEEISQDEREKIREEENLQFRYKHISRSLVGYDLKNKTSIKWHIYCSKRDIICIKEATRIQFDKQN